MRYQNQKANRTDGTHKYNQDAATTTAGDYDQDTSTSQSGRSRNSTYNDTNATAENYNQESSTGGSSTGGSSNKKKKYNDDGDDGSYTTSQTTNVQRDSDGNVISKMTGKKNSTKY